ncbi:prepilin-type N-terminal cleavage/methylation domain-containing protein [Luteolibacter yonseiensis]|uniref:Prepilin-type N-terminal cleavage/methylation domain-containing protein n=1 Tax=Luteolibacter yonseiensis TaxID=1144680 RepID=A0A934VA01_9BACT|nr:prepilin-type N-terminal cleavage/methylation domain-containing protein [Luteolibacter yonseiensis]MBK1815693.1 prepilin-type N-terminal cleavage/methylation domain-containing protein [Luteolibacter yonseiensis]
MIRLFHRPHRGFTLIELSIAIMLGMATAGMVLALFNQQIAFLKIFKAQTFLTEEAPLISMHVSKLVGKADRFRLHASVDDALKGKDPRLTSSPVVVLNFRQPDGVMRASILAYEDKGSGNALYYYVVPLNGVLGDPQWTVTKAPRNVVFAVVNGVLRMTLTGIHDEEITYSGAMQQ